MKRLLADLHIHTALSPCAAKDMTPPALVQAAVRKGLAMIGICDHNSARNAAAVQEAAGKDLAVLAGIEITTAEEAHVLGLFPDAEAALATGDQVRTTLPETTAASRKFGEQLVMNTQGEVVGREPRMLSAASAYSLSEAVRLIKQHNGIPIAAHVNRPSFSVISQLGFLPADAGFEAIEVFAPMGSTARANELASAGLPIIASSDSHFLSDIGSCRVVLEIAAPTFAELILALNGQRGRRCCHA